MSRKPETKARRTEWEEVVRGGRRGIIAKTLHSIQNGACPICDRPMPVMTMTSIDHKRSLARGGSNDLGNLQLVHISCNVLKGSASTVVARRKLGLPDYPRKATV